MDTLTRGDAPILRAQKVGKERMCPQSHCQKSKTANARDGHSPMVSTQLKRRFGKYVGTVRFSCWIAATQFPLQHEGKALLRKSEVLPFHRYGIRDYTSTVTKLLHGTAVNSTALDRLVEVAYVLQFIENVFKCSTNCSLFGHF